MTTTIIIDPQYPGTLAALQRLAHRLGGQVRTRGWLLVIEIKRRPS